MADGDTELGTLNTIDTRSQTVHTTFDLNTLARLDLHSQK